MPASQSELELKRLEVDASARRGEKYTNDPRLSDEQNQTLERYHSDRVLFYRGERSTTAHRSIDQNGNSDDNASGSSIRFRKVVLIVCGIFVGIWLIFRIIASMDEHNREAAIPPPKRIEGVDYMRVTVGTAPIHAHPNDNGLHIANTIEGLPIDSFKDELKNPQTKNGYTYISFKHKNLFIFHEGSDKRFAGGWYYNGLLKTETISMHTYLYRLNESKKGK